MGKHRVWRRQLAKLDEEQGIIWTIDLLEKELKIFDALKSYKDCQKKDDRCKLFTYEELFHPAKHFSAMSRLLEWLELDVSQDNLKSIVDNLSFTRRTNRKPGQEDRNHHLRKGVAGDYVNHFTPAITERFWRAYGNNSTF